MILNGLTSLFRSVKSDFNYIQCLTSFTASKEGDLSDIWAKSEDAARSFSNPSLASQASPFFSTDAILLRLDFFE